MIWHGSCFYSVRGDANEGEGLMQRLNSPFLLQETIELVGSAEQRVRLSKCVRAAGEVAERSQSAIDTLKRSRFRSGEASPYLEALSGAVSVLVDELDLLQGALTGAQREVVGPRLSKLSRLETELLSTIRRLEHPIVTRKGYRHALRDFHRIGWIARSWRIQCARTARLLYLSLD